MSAVDPVADEHALTERFLVGRGMRPMGVGAAVPEERFERFGGMLPNVVLMAWRRFGFDGFNDGQFWITDPVAWEPIVDAWVAGLEDELPFWDKWWCLTRTAFGSMELWGERSGTSLEIDPRFGMLFPYDSRRRDWNDPDQFERMGRILFTNPVTDTGYPTDTEPMDDDLKELLGDDQEDIDLIAHGLSKLGALGPDEVYGFLPPFAVTEAFTPEAMSIQPAAEHLRFLASFPRKVMPDLESQYGGFLDAIRDAHVQNMQVDQRGEAGA